LTIDARVAWFAATKVAVHSISVLARRTTNAIAIAVWCAWIGRARHCALSALSAREPGLTIAYFCRRRGVYLDLQTHATIVAFKMVILIVDTFAHWIRSGYFIKKNLN